MTEVNQTCAALSDATRMAIVRLLRHAPSTPGQLAKQLGITKPTMSRHLKVLREAGIVVEQIQSSDARVRVYRLRQEPFSELRSFAEYIEGFWRDQLESFNRRLDG